VHHHPGREIGLLRAQRYGSTLPTRHGLQNAVLLNTGNEDESYFTKFTISQMTARDLKTSIT